MTTAAIAAGPGFPLAPPSTFTITFLPAAIGAPYPSERRQPPRYAAAIAAIPDSARELLQSDRLAHLVTLNEDGSPQVSCVWVGMDGDEIVCGHVPHLRKVENIRRDPRVALSMEGAGVGEHGLKHYLVVYGTARVTEGGAPELLQRLAHTYLGPDVDFPTMPNPPPGYITHITVDRVAGAGPWAEH